ncbi:MAG: hypothetical protein ABJG78_12495 [Cyclobacteriaceae bacterium]
MRKLLIPQFLYCFLCFLSFGSFAQTNTFPTSGNVGIGTTSPQNTLHITSATTSSWIRMQKLNDTKETGLMLTSGNRTDFYFYTDNTAESPLQIQASGLAGEGDGSPRIRLPRTNKDLYLGLSGGNVAIGMTTPTSTLDVVRGSGVGGTAQFRGTDRTSHFSYSTNEDTYIRGGKMNANVLINDNGGNVGIGTSAPTYAKLQVRGGATHELFAVNRPDSDVPALYLGNDGSNRAAIASNNADLTFGRDYAGAYTEYARIQNGTGNLGIGTTTPDEKLTVKGRIHTEEVLVDLSVSAPDYVFAKDYNLPTLESVEAYIRSEHHLPEIPSAKEMEADGVELGTMNMLLLKKIEELTLYQIDMMKVIKEQNKRIEQIEN